MAKILVVGATGAQGGAVIRALQKASAAANHSVYALSRNPSSEASKRLDSQGIHVLHGDLTDTDSLTETLKQVNRAFLITTPEKSPGVEEQAGKNFVKAAKAAGLEHVVFTSVDGAERDSKVPHFESKFQIEKDLVSSGLGYTILRPVAFMDNFPLQPGFGRAIALGLFRAALGDKPLQLISVKDIGYVGAQALMNPAEYKGQAIPLAGDELKVSEMAATFSKVQSQHARVAWLPGFATAILPYDFKQMFKTWTLFFRERGYTVDIPALRTRYPRLSSFEDYLREKSVPKDGSS